ncbi:hypothetical protein F7725_001643 [Dissostichus mawsoni]|uniref:Uncharacterized protein n=1 Tax=Dissostichus mawsoni TaxID=36200 RepID=A0A7J5Y068_DISMA|nr:hypothetical protein F7725_001643 [Dissostichus mawsoni]
MEVRGAACPKPPQGRWWKFPTCAHKRLQGRAHKKKWIKPSEFRVNTPFSDMAADVTFKITSVASATEPFLPDCITTRMPADILTTKAGEQRFKIRYPKYKAGHVVKKILVEATFSYVDDLMREVVDLCKKPSADRPVQLEEPPTLSSAMEKPDKAEAIKAHASRFQTK